ncbi:hypothetical protein GCM10022231_02270 [Gordonia caeni]|uniref:DUF5642 domain-containing protein n=2 Tax=Gordonia caeni TaxID=1007097 RepID=A0ABP7NJE3_9ACTN
MLALAGCGGDGEGSAPDAAESADPSKVQSLVLPADDFPAGFEVQEIPADQLQSMTDQILEETKNAEITPASCVQLGLMPEHVDTSDVGLAVATSGTTNLGTAVTTTSPSMADQRAALSGKCAHLTVKMTSGAAAGAEGTVDQKEVPAPASRADEALAVEQESTSTVSGTTTETKSLLGFATVNGYTVTVQYTSLNAGDLDRAVFDEFFVSAVDHVADATS